MTADTAKKDVFDPQREYRRTIESRLAVYCVWFTEARQYVGDCLRYEDFADPFCGWIVSTLATQDVNDLDSVVSILHQNRKSGNWMSQLAKLTEKYGEYRKPVYMHAYVRDMLEWRREREMDRLGKALPDMEPHEAAKELERIEYETTAKGRENDLALLYAEIADGMDQKKRIGLSTGIESLDAVTVLAPQELIVVAAGNGVGKSLICIQIASHVLRQRNAVTLFSLEMSREQVFRRLVSCHMGISTGFLKGKTNSEEDRRRFVEGGAIMSNLRLHLEDRPGVTVSQIRKICQEQKAKQGLDLVIIDYLQLVGAANRRSHRTEQIEEVARDLKNLAKTLCVPILCPCQMNRSSEDKPTISALKGSSEIGDAADQVWFITRSKEGFQFTLKKNRDGQADLDFPITLDYVYQQIREPEQEKPF